MMKSVEAGRARTPVRAPIGSLLRAAASGLLAVAPAACKDDSAAKDTDHAHDSELSDDELSALCTVKVDDAVGKAAKDQDLEKVCSDKVKAAQDSYKPSDDKLTVLCADKVGAADDMCMSDLDKANKNLADGKAKISSMNETCNALTTTREEKATNSEQKEYTFAQLTKMCDDRGGYTQVAASCGGHNTCKGFSYGDWGPGAATLTEHSCAGANGCLGVYCTETAKDQNRKPKDLYAMKYPDPGPSPCTSCHAQHNDKDEADASTFIVWAYDQNNSPWYGPERTLDNWKNTHTAAQQERIVAFGVPMAILPDGTAVNHMAPYYKYLSRNEIAGLVKYLREELKPVLSKVKTKDP
jgi:hypothetical protein